VTTAAFHPGSSFAITGFNDERIFSLGSINRYNRVLNQMLVWQVSRVEISAPI